MGLLDDLLGGLAGASMEGRAPREAPRGGSGGGMSQILMALMPVVLAMLSNRGGAAGHVSPGASGGGGLGDVLGQVLGGATRGGAAGGGLGDVLGQVLGGREGGGPAGGGGLGDILAQLQRAGFGEQADSWVGRGANKPIPPEAMPDVFGHDGLAEIARRAGLTEDETSRGLSELLPEVVDRVTPEGEVPGFDALTDSVDDLARRFGGR